MTYLFTTSQQLNTCNLYITNGVLVSLCSSYSPRDHNQNKVYHDLYYAIPATVFLAVMLVYVS